VEDLAPPGVNVSLQTSLHQTAENQSIIGQAHVQPQQEIKQRQPDSVRIPLLTARPAWMPVEKQSQPSAPPTSSLQPLPLLQLNWPSIPVNKDFQVGSPG